jgi:hypothetical protein
VSEKGFPRVTFTECRNSLKIRNRRIEQRVERRKQLERSLVTLNRSPIVPTTATELISLSVRCTEIVQRCSVLQHVESIVLNQSDSKVESIDCLVEISPRGFRIATARRQTESLQQG